MGDKTKEQLLRELSEVQKMLEERTEAQGRMIKKFQTLINNEELFSQVIDSFPYPIIIFTPQYILFMVNKAFTEEMKTQFIGPEKEIVRILLYKIEDMQLAIAIEQVFTGKTFFLEDLKNPFSMFGGTAKQGGLQSNHFHKAVIFPVPAEDAEITHGVIVFMS